MKKFYKSFILIIFVCLFLTGCGWKDVQNNYADLLNQNPSCTYYSTNSKMDANGLDKIVLSANYDGFYANGIVIVSVKDSPYTVTLNNRKVNFSKDFSEKFLTYYRDNKKCPENIYVPNEELQSVSLNSCNGCVGYSLKNQAAENQKQINCHISTAIDCVQIFKNDGEGKTYLELGYFEENNTIKKYMMVDKDIKFSSMKYSTTETGGFEVDFQNETYIIQDNSINNIFLSNNKMAIASDIKISESSENMTTAGMHYTYYIRDVNSEAYGEETIKIIPQGNSGDKLDGTTASYRSNINYTNLCSNTEISQVMKILGTVVYIMKVLVPILIIVFGIIDFAKAVTSDDEQALNKATQALIKRLISGIVIFFIPTIIMAILNLIDIADGVQNLENTEFGSCTKCLLKLDC